MHFSRQVEARNVKYERKRERKENYTEREEKDIEIEPVEAGFASSSIQSVKAEDAPPMKRFAGETLETSDIDLSALSQIDFLKSFDDIKIKAEGPRGTTISIDSPL